MALSWWLWLLFGFVLLLLELATPGGFYIFFFGAGAILVGLLAALGLAGPPWVQWLLFGLISTSALLLFRKPLQNRIGNLPVRNVDTMIGETAIAITEIPSQGTGKAELRGSAWSARNIGEEAILAGRRCRVERIDGLTLYLRGFAAGEER
jgi:membrane protein implicated in regulation of membrane protease activity